MIRKVAGTYMLMLRLDRQVDVAVGRAGQMRFAPGFYAYVGSACGPGGLAARLQRYARAGGRRHWHIDFFLPHAELVGVLVREGRMRRECLWAVWAGRAACSCGRGFGASDCRCSSHLFFVGTSSAEASRFREAAVKALGASWANRRELFHPGISKPS